MKKNNIKIFISITTALLLGTLIPEAVNAKPMEFKLIPPNQPVELFGNAWQIFADGELDSKSAEKLQKLIDKNKIPDRSRIYLSSLGGSLVGGIELGKVIRKNGLFTNVGKLQGIKEENKIKGVTWKEPLISPSNCMSACVLSYMGGSFRFLIKNSDLGVHRFYSGSRFMDSDAAQITSSYVLQYISSMGVDDSIFHEMVKAGKDEINILPRTVSNKLNLVNEGYSNTSWTLQSINGGIYVKGERDTWRGVNKFLTACDTSTKKLFQTFIFDTEGRDQDLAKMQSVSIFTNSKTIPIEKYMWSKALIANNTLTAYMTLPTDLLVTLINSESIGVAFQYAHDAPFFLGFEGMNLSEGKDKLENIIKLCKNN